MESVTRFWSYEAQNIRCVREADFDRVTAEREALQLLLNDRDGLEDQITSLEQRRQAEQQACQAAERRVEELAELLLHCRKRIRWHGDPMLDRVEAALNPAAEAVSHE